MTNRRELTIDGESGKPIEPPRPGRTKPIKLDGLSAIRDEMGRVYREARAGKIDTADATKLTYMLWQMREMVVLLDLEQRIAQLETINGKS